MTGYGQAAEESRRMRVAVSLRAVNHRHLDLVIRTRGGHLANEQAIRELLAGELTRGRVEVGIDILYLESPTFEVQLRGDLIEAIQRQITELAARGVVTGRLEVRDLLNLPDVIRVIADEVEWQPDDEELLCRVARRALEQLVEMRELEGKKLSEILGRLVGELERHVTFLSDRRQAVRDEIHSTLRERVASLLGDCEIDPQRLAQEVALLVERSDVAEELDRLAAHLTHLKEVSRGSGGVGRRLDFLVQEISRELNTVGAKCRDTEMSRRVLDAKGNCEQLREQVQNVE